MKERNKRTMTTNKKVYKVMVIHNHKATKTMQTTSIVKAHAKARELREQGKRCYVLWESTLNTQ